MGRYKARRGGKKARPDHREIAQYDPEALDALDDLELDDGPARATGPAPGSSGRTRPRDEAAGGETGARTSGRADGRPPRPPEIFLRQLRYEDALRRLEHQVRAHVRHGTGEVLVVHGRGRGSPEGRGVLGGAVRDWCNAHPELVSDWRSAPPSWGGDGALVLTLNV